MKNYLLKTKWLVVFLTSFLILSSGIFAQTDKRKLTFSDEFNAAKNSPMDSTKWTAEIGGEGWGNQELQYYTNSTENAFHNGEGSLVIKVLKQDLSEKAFKCWYGKCKYTSARLITKEKFTQKYGRFEARIKIPKGQGMWSAFWMLGDNIEEVGWSKCGEIDIMENIGREPKTIHGTIHGPGYEGTKGIGSPYKLKADSIFADDFHVYAVEWKKDKLEWFVDGKIYQTLTPKNLPDSKKWVYDHSFFLLLNLAIGGNWGGEPDKTTIFPNEMLIDYVRVYE